MNILCLDAEFAVQEILELSVWRLTGWPMKTERTQALHQYFRPARERRWPGSQRVHHITPQMVADKPRFSRMKAGIQKMFDEADVIVGFAVENDLEALRFEGISGLDKKRVIDVRDLHWLVNTSKDGVGLDERKGLSVTAEQLGMEFSEDEAHGADYDTRMTLACFERLMEDFAATIGNGAEETGHDAAALVDTYYDRWQEASENYYREFAKGWVYIQKWKDTYRIKANRLSEPGGKDVVAVVRVAARNRALDEIDQHFSRRRDSQDTRCYNLKPEDIKWFETYSNEYDGQEQMHRKMMELRQSAARLHV